MSSPLLEFDMAQKIIESGEEFLDEIKDKAKFKRLGKLWYFDEEEYNEVSFLQRRIQSYIEADTSIRPLSIAVFGPPGSGKSHAVKAIQFEIQNSAQSRPLPYFEINLTQVGSSSHLQAELRYIQRATAAISSTASAGNSGNEPVPFVFFDEFDAPRAGAPLGWLDWFLSPMNDGVIGHGEGKFEFRKAIYIFAGGTALTFTDFIDNKSRDFIKAKGPDFISRINVSLNVRGPNHEDARLLRRAAIIRQVLNGGRELGRGKLTLPIDPEFATCLLHQGRYKHGSRSITVVCELSKNSAKKASAATLSKDHLPDRNVLEMHVDQGHLDREHIGGLIGISIGKGYQSDLAAPPAKLFLEMVSVLWTHGATVGYGGKWDQKLTQELLSDLEAWQINGVLGKHRVEIFSRKESSFAEAGDHAYIVPTFVDWEHNGDGDILSDTVGATRMRWMMACRCVARIFVGGDVTPAKGRMSGLLEEMIFALALRQPIYVVGAFGNFGAIAGQMLGLGSIFIKPEIGVSRVLFEEPRREFKELLEKNRHAFQPIPGTVLPISGNDAPPFLMQYAFGGKLWPDNGLSLDENRELYRETDARLVASLILKGLRRRFGA